MEEVGSEEGRWWVGRWWVVRRVGGGGGCRQSCG